MDLITYFIEVTASRRETPTEDLCSYIANGKIDGEYLADADLFGYYIIVITAGHETTRTAMSGGLKALLDFPEQMQKLIDNPDLMKLGTEEMIRWTVPVTQFCRVFVSLGGGGLVAGVAGFLKAVRPGIRIVACSPENSKVMVESVRAGRVLDLPSLPTLSDGTAGGVEADSITFELCRELVDEYVTVSEEEIRDSLRLVVGAHHVMIEGSAAVAVAAYRRMPEQCAGRHVAILLCGANIDSDTLQGVLSQG